MHQSRLWTDTRVQKQEEKRKGGRQRETKKGTEGEEGVRMTLSRLWTDSQVR